MPDVQATSQSTTSGVIQTDQLEGLEYRNIGPHRAGRVVAVAGHPRDSNVFYFGACAGGVWRTTDAGSLWENISDGYFQTAAVGAIAVAESDPNVIYAGTGEHTIRSDVSHGDGIYKSTDGGKTWRNVGLKDTRHIAKIRIHPQNADLVYVAALGHAWGQNEERGVFRSRDGGETWEKILFRSPRAGAIDLSMDPNNPRILYASIWEAQRNPYTFWSGGPDSSLYKSTDGGDTWTEITRNQGLPKGVLGKIGVAVSPARPDRVWALVEAEDGALFRSDNGGETWQRINENPDLRHRAFYYMHVFADPQDADVVWVLNLQCWKSIDGGSNFTGMPTLHGDNHDLWIDPTNTQRMIEGNDGGASVSLNGGYSWSTILNQPTAQFYHVTADTAIPYRVYGSQQDNSAISVASQSMDGAITEMEWFVPGGGESGYIAVRPDNPSIQYAGDHHGRLTRHDRTTGQERVINVWPAQAPIEFYEGAESQKYRFQWTFPIFLSPFDPHILYTAANHLFRSADEGTTWEQISPDLTRAEPHTMVSAGGPITRDNSTAEFYSTIFAAVESPHEQGTFWVGSDDGLVHISRDGGKTWENITPKELPEWALISIIEVSPHQPGAAYLAATRYKMDDNSPYLYKTDDYGKSWTEITNGIPADDFTRVIREDPECRGLLYAGTETGLYVSFDDGQHWQPLQTNLPVCPIHDLIVKDGDLVVGTHGRSFWILDDVSPLHEIARDRQARNRLFQPRDTIRFKISEGFDGFYSGEGPNVRYHRAGPVTYAFKSREKPDGSRETTMLNAGKNRPNGVLISYFLTEQPEEDITLTILDEQGKQVRQFSSKKEKPEEVKKQNPEEGNTEGPAATDGESPAATEVLQEAIEGSTTLVDPEADAEQQGPFIPKNQGMNRFTWNFRYENATLIPGDKFSAFSTPGPVVPPGKYQAQLKVGDETFTQSFEIVKDPRVEATQQDLESQYDLGMKVRDTMSKMNEGIIETRDVREQVESWDKRLARHQNADQVRQSARDLIDQLTSVEEEFIITKWPSMFPSTNVPTKLNMKLAMLGGYVGSADAVPTKSEYEAYDELSKLINAQLDKLNGLLENDLPRLNDAIRQLEVPAVVRKPAGSDSPAQA